MTAHELGNARVKPCGKNFQVGFLHQFIKEPTRNNTVLDLLLTSNMEMIEKTGRMPEDVKINKKYFFKYSKGKQKNVRMG